MAGRKFMKSVIGREFYYSHMDTYFKSCLELYDIERIEWYVAQKKKMPKYISEIYYVRYGGSTHQLGVAKSELMVCRLEELQTMAGAAKKLGVPISPQELREFRCFSERLEKRRDFLRKARKKLKQLRRNAVDIHLYWNSIATLEPFYSPMGIVWWYQAQTYESHHKPSRRTRKRK